MNLQLFAKAEGKVVTTPAGLIRVGKTSYVDEIASHVVGLTSKGPVQSAVGSTIETKGTIAERGSNPKTIKTAIVWPPNDGGEIQFNLSNSIYELLKSGRIV